MGVLRALAAVLLVVSPIVLAGLYGLESRALTLSDVEQAISLGVQAVSDAARPIVVNGAYYRVMPDHPSPTISVEYNGQLYVPGSFFDPGDRDYRTELVSVTTTSIAWRYYFNVDADEDDDIIIYAELRNIDQSTDKLFIYVDTAEYTFNLRVGAYNPDVYLGVGQGWSTNIYINEVNDYKFHSVRYMNRHSTIIASWLLEDEGYTYTAEKLRQLWQLTGFQFDVYAPVFGRSTLYFDDFFDYKTGTWLGNGYSAHPRTISPSDSYLNYPYKSRMYILDAAYMFDIGLRGWEDAPLYLLLKAMHLLDKYGASKQAEAEQLIAKAIEEGAWDGYGLRRAMLDPTWIATGQRSLETVPFWYRAYPTYLNAALLAALVKYYQVTGDRWIAGNDILYMADRLAGILVKIQWRYEHLTPWGTVRLALFRGWWPAAYDIGSLIAKPSAWGLIDTATQTADNVAGALAKVGLDIPPESIRPMPSEWPFAIVNSESTILAVQALKLYLQLAQQLGRQPVDPTEPTLVAPRGIFHEGGGGGYATIHEGETAGDGRWVRAYVYSSAPGWSGADYWRYQYAKYRVELGGPGEYSVRVDSMVHYETFDGLGSRVEIYLVVKLFDSAGNVIVQAEKTVDIVDENNVYLPTVRDKAVSVELNAGPLLAGTYYVEVGLKAVVADGGGLANARAHIDRVVMSP